MKNTNVTIRLDYELKARAEELFDDLGMSLSTAINVFLRQAVREQGIPFTITRKAAEGKADASEEGEDFNPFAMSDDNIYGQFGNFSSLLGAMGGMEGLE